MINAYMEQMRVYADRVLRDLDSLEAWIDGGPMPARAAEWKRLFDATTDSTMSDNDVAEAEKALANRFWDIDDMTLLFIMQSAFHEATKGHEKDDNALLDSMYSDIRVDGLIADRMAEAAEAALNGHDPAPAAPPQS